MVTAIRKASAWPFVIQFACTLAIVGCGFLIQLPLGTQGVGHPFVSFLVCVLIIALMFGRPSGFLAVASSSFLSLSFFAPGGSVQLDLLEIELYAALAAGAVILADQIRCTLIMQSDTNIRLASEDTKKTLQLREIAHRVANNFASLDALIRQRAMASKDPKIQFAFDQASELVHVVARLNNRLNLASCDSEVDSGIFVPDLCEDLQSCARPGVAIECRAESHDIALTAAVPLGLIINELVTNSLKYAFPDQRPGVVNVAFSREDDHYHLQVEDNGVGMSGEVKGSGLGLRLLQGFSRAMKGQVDIRSTSGGTSASVKFEAPRPAHQDEIEPRATMIN
jgi:two-component system, sensor histidine kinase PdtaS